MDAPSFSVMAATRARNSLHSCRNSSKATSSAYTTPEVEKAGHGRNFTPSYSAISQPSIIFGHSWTKFSWRQAGLFALKCLPILKESGKKRLGLERFHMGPAVFQYRRLTSMLTGPLS